MITIANEVWIATALLHRQYPERTEFTISEIRDRVEREGLAGRLRPGMLPHLYSHCVANRPPKPARLRLLFATGKGSRRLYRPGDLYDRGREHGPSLPEPAELPTAYRELLDWYRETYLGSSGADYDPTEQPDAILALRGLGKDLWADEHPDRYVERLRSGWQ